MPVLPGSRIRDNGVFGTLVDNPLTAVSTVMNSSDLADLGPIIGDHATITLDPLRQHGDPEIVIVTFHTPAGPVATIERGAYGTTAREHPQGTLWVHAACAEDFIEVLTSATRPPDPYEGQFIYETDTKLVLVFDGTSWVEFGGGGGGGGGAPVTLGYAQVVASQTGITSETDLTGLAVTVTVPEGRRIRITGHLLVQGSAITTRANLRIREGATQLQLRQDSIATGPPDNAELTAIWVGTPSAGTHTYKLTLQASVTGNVSSLADPTFPAFILVEDITGDPLPYDPASVPVGLLGHAEIVADQGGIATNALVNNLSVNVSVPAGRTLRINTYFDVFSTVDGAVPLVEILQDGVTISRSTLELGDAVSRSFTMLGSVLESPPAGAHTYTVRLTNALGGGSLTVTAAANRPGYLSVEDITPTPSPSSGAPGSTLGYSEWTGGTFVIGATPTPTDISGLSATVTVPAGRRLRITGYGHIRSSVATDTVYLRLVEDGGNRGFAYGNELASSPNSPNLMHILTPSAGTHTYKIQGVRQAGSGSLSVYGAATEPSWILVEDITGSVWPEGEAVTPGMVASEPWTDFVPVVTQNVNLTLNVAYARYFKLGRLVHLQINTGFLSSGTAGQTVAFTLPIQAAAGGFRLIGNADFFDASTLAKYQLGARLNNSTTVVTFQYASSNSDHLLGTTGAFTAAVTNGDALTLNLMYESAS